MRCAICESELHPTKECPKAQDIELSPEEENFEGFHNPKPAKAPLPLPQKERPPYFVKNE